jgi:hypothetical protein
MQYRSKALVILFVLLIANRVVAAESKEAKIRRALSAAPPNVASSAKVADTVEKGNMTVLRDGHNGFTCVPGHVGVVGDGPASMDEAAVQGTLDWMAHKPKPTNTRPGIIYQLACDSDWSATDPWATSGTPHKWVAGWVLVFPFDPKTSGLSDQLQDHGTWIMWAGTPYAHLMIMQKPLSATSPRLIAFHEKAGRSQVGSSLLFDKISSPA